MTVNQEGNVGVIVYDKPLVPFIVKVPLASFVAANTPAGSIDAVSDDAL